MASRNTTVGLPSTAASRRTSATATKHIDKKQVVFLAPHLHLALASPPSDVVADSMGLYHQPIGSQRRFRELNWISAHKSVSAPFNMDPPSLACLVRCGRKPGQRNDDPSEPLFLHLTHPCDKCAHRYGDSNRLSA